MTRSGSPESPLETASGAAGAQATEAFDLLSNETRLAILLALWEAYDPHTQDDAVPFSELRKRVGIRDSGQFNYHLDKLDDHFVRKTNDGYTLQPVGLKLVQTVIAGTGTEETLPPTEIDTPCHRCGGSTAITYQDGWLYHICTECESHISDSKQGAPEGVLFMEPFSPAGLSDRTAEEVFAAGVFRLLQVMTMKTGRLCPRCSGIVESSVEVCETHEVDAGDRCSACGRTTVAHVRWVCSVCKYRGSAPPSLIAVVHPASVAFYHDRGIDIGYPVNDFGQAKQILSFIRNADQDLISTEPFRVRAKTRYEGDELRLTLDAEMDLIKVEEEKLEAEKSRQ